VQGSFTRTGLIMERRRAAEMVEFERMQVCLATVPLAVTASSAFPGFFPPLTVHSSEIGASKSAFSLLTFTDGGVFDNLGVRAFRFIEHRWSEGRDAGEYADERQTKLVNVGAKGSNGSNEHDSATAADLASRVGRDGLARPVRGKIDVRSHSERSQPSDLEGARDSAVVQCDVGSS
jgi:predicted acylesterase/phospholipase RssA